VPARQVVRRRERIAGVRVRALFRHCRAPEGAPEHDAPKRARLSPELSLDELAIRGGQTAATAAGVVWQWCGALTAGLTGTLT
jgi:hypothetical protein